MKGMAWDYFFMSDNNMMGGAGLDEIGEENEDDDDDDHDHEGMVEVLVLDKG